MYPPEILARELADDFGADIAEIVRVFNVQAIRFGRGKRFNGWKWDLETVSLLCVDCGLRVNGMAEIEPIDYLRRHDFRFSREGDRGQYWTNGEKEVFLRQTYKENSELRALFQDIKDAFKQRERKALAEANEAPEVAVERKITVDERPELNVKVLAEVRESLNKIGAKRKPFTKLKGTERLYVYGRMKAMFAQGADDKTIADTLNGEGARMGNGYPWMPSEVSKIRRKWNDFPARVEKYAAILRGRMPKPAPTPAVQTPAAPAVVATPSTTQPLPAPVIVPAPAAAVNHPAQQPAKTIPVRQIIREELAGVVLPVAEKLSGEQRLMRALLNNQEIPSGEKVNVLLEWLESVA